VNDAVLRRERRKGGDRDRREKSPTYGVSTSVKNGEIERRLKD
jgi:hypothetical protein